MPVTVRFNPAQLSTQAQIIPDATPMNDGAMTKQQAADLLKTVARLALLTSPGGWLLTGKLNKARGANDIVALPGNSAGAIAISGGFGGNNTVQSCEIFSSVTNTWTVAADYPVLGGVAFAATARLPDSSIVSVGGANRWTAPTPSIVFYNQTNRFDPVTGTWTPQANCPISAAYPHRQVVDSIPVINTDQNLFPNGRVFVTGGGELPLGVDGLVNPSKKAHIFDPNANAWTVAANSVNARDAHKAISLLDGRVFVGWGRANGGGPVRGGATFPEVYNAATNTWSAVAAPPLIDGEDFNLPGGSPPLLAGERSASDLVLLPDGKVMVVGGLFNSVPTLNPGAAAASISSPQATVMRISGLAGASLANSQVGLFLRISGAANPANNGLFRIFNVVNATTADVYNPAVVAPDANNGAITWSLAAVIPSGRMSTLIYDPAGNSWVVGPPMIYPRGWVRTVTLQTGHILAMGGFDLTMRPLATCEILDLSVGFWQRTADVAVGKIDSDGTPLSGLSPVVQRVALLSSGRVLFEDGGDANSANMNNSQTFIFVPEVIVAQARPAPQNSVNSPGHLANAADYQATYGL